MSMIEQSQLLRFADYFFLVFHTTLIVFNMIGWIWLRLRKLHLIVISLTLASWIFLGIWYGLGYCPLTDWHWSVLRKLGHSDLPISYIEYLLHRLLGINIEAQLADFITIVVAVVAFLISVKLNFFHNKTRPPAIDK